MILGDMKEPLSIFLSMRKWEMLLLNIIWAICTKMVKVFPKTLPKLRNGIESPPNKEMLLLNIIWVKCTKMVEVYLKTMLKLWNAF